MLGGTVVDPGADARSRSCSSRFSNAVSLSQSRRAAGFIPFAFAFAGGLALLARTVWVLPFALLAGFLLERQWPGDFAYGLRHGGPGAVTWFALIAGAGGARPRDRLRA